MRKHLLLFFIFPYIFSCVSVKNSIYLQGDSLQKKEIKRINNIPYKLQVNDVLFIGITSNDESLVQIFSSQTSKNSYFSNYPIDDLGLIRIPNFDLILSGPIPPNPSELLINEKANRMIEILKDTYDYIIIDTPPVGLVSDALELFKFSDAVIYVVRQDYSEKGMMKMIEDKYKNKEVTNISYVLNDFSKKKYGYGYGYGYGYNYGYGYGADENDQKNGIISKIIRFLKSNK